MEPVRQQKPWGSTIPTCRDKDVHADRISVVAGGYCSIHLHAAKTNVFHVLSGRLYVRHFTPAGDRLGGAHISAGGTHVVPASIWHQFWAVGDVEAVEVYLPAAGVLDAEDIGRLAGLGIGGVAATYGEMNMLWAKAFDRPPLLVPPLTADQQELFANV